MIVGVCLFEDCLGTGGGPVFTWFIYICGHLVKHAAAQLKWPVISNAAPCTLFFFLQYLHVYYNSTDDYKKVRQKSLLEYLWYTNISRSVAIYWVLNFIFPCLVFDMKSEMWSLLLWKKNVDFVFKTYIVQHNKSSFNQSHSSRDHIFWFNII